MSKIKIGFEVTDNWDIQAFRDVIMVLQNRPEEFNSKLKVGDVELFLISNNDSSPYIWRIASIIGLDSEHAFNPGNIALKLARIDTEKVQLYLDNLQSTVLQIDELSQYADGILVDYKPDAYNLNMKWYQELQEKVKRLLNESC